MFQGLNSEDLIKAYQAAQKFSSNYSVVRYLIDDSLKYLDKLQINSQPRVRLYLQSRGFFNFETLQRKMSGFTKAFEDKTTENLQEGLFTQQTTEKYRINEEHDYKEWEEYHIITRQKEGDFLDQSLLPAGIQTMIAIRDGQSVPIEKLNGINGGSKYGKKIQNPDVKWTEEWFEAELMDSSEILPGKLPGDPVKIWIKFYSKLWTNIEKNLIEGESCFQILDSNKVLQYEMKDNLKTENILNKEGSLKTRVI